MRSYLGFPRKRSTRLVGARESPHLHRLTMKIAATNRTAATAVADAIADAVIAAAAVNAVTAAIAIAAIAVVKPAIATGESMKTDIKAAIEEINAVTADTGMGETAGIRTQISKLRNGSMKIDISFSIIARKKREQNQALN